MMRKSSYYLDTNVISYLANPKITDEEFRKRLKHRVQSGDIEIIGSPEIIEELAGAARNYAKQFERSLRLFWTLAGNKVLCNGDELLKREIKKGSKLLWKEAFLDDEMVCNVRALSHDDSKSWNVCLENRLTNGKKFANTMNEWGEIFQGGFYTDGFTSRDVRKNANQLMPNEKVIQGVFHYLLERRKKALGLPDNETNWPDIDQLPRAWAYVSFIVALFKKHNTSKGHKYSDSDCCDSIHYANASMAECLVTSDTSFANTCQLIPNGAVSVIMIEDFKKRIMGDP